MKKSNFIVFSCLLLAVVSCNSQKEKAKLVSSIDTTLQEKVTSILEERLKSYDAPFGDVIVMEVQTGQIKALVGLERTDSTYQSTDYYFCAEHPAGTSRVMSFMAMLESGKIHLNDTVDTRNGILAVGLDTIHDHNWRTRGGYGEIDVKWGFLLHSDVATVLCLQKAFQNEDEYYKQLHKLPINKPNSVKGLTRSDDDEVYETDYIYDAIGYHASSPVQTLAFYNAIANNGRMVLPQIYKDSTVVISPQIASEKTINDIQDVLRMSVTEGLCRKAQADSVSVAGYAGTLNIGDNTFLLDFCGYFPAENPQYSIVVTMCKEGIPASGGTMAGGVFKEIADYMVREKFVK